ncbi:MAG: leucyl/phenylalanyl-tRNA--protein transferase [Bacteroidetes bacterium 24-39-8]|nr:MAG: leucyl/phenylalanyl-tRNA--protein transferase [Sphingobacteriia bacterium 35-40-8]OYZ47382.1 MAG: leucyl/phenylalanyl-tRNA--protein transferase [Bacteroidetes bacterium 24-39-8]OZA67034.1 MAG: leucyl/phenylalanyl-tRNA--protein transferase [Sphingobacteriia bacterium 39-39-8]HQR93840.1 leucyl/phenylalanyl-tRNA--protein transferase [Sediminibacterium sp.]HQS54139.1 leucyl/phenylalanyl-tRNA--protein transferase [Sediminibacterium sp.]
MPLFTLDNSLWFPPLSDADEEGLLAIGGDLSIDRLLIAYKHGIFPWFDGPVPLWWSPDPRFVLFPTNIKVSKSMEQVIKKGDYRFSTNTAFKQVIANCKNQKREGQNGTWITPELETSFNQLHDLGFAVSAETWLGDKLVGGLYGIRMGKVFFGESMFAHNSNASKFAFIHFVKLLASQGVELIDCQVYTAHLESLGAEMIGREDFANKLSQLI